MSKSIFNTMESLIQKGESASIATIVNRKGSAPMSSDAKMLVHKDGTIEGTVGGGCLEAEVWQTAMDVLESKKSEKLRFDLTEQDAADSGHICGGIVEIFVEPLESYSIELLSAVNKIRRTGGSAAMATQISPFENENKKLLILKDGSTIGSLSKYEAEIWRESSRIMKEGQPTTLEFDKNKTDKKDISKEHSSTEIFVEPITTQPKIYLFGGGHVSFCVAQTAHLAGFRTSIVEDRPSFANKERFPMAEDFYVGEFPGIFDSLEIDESSYLAIITRGHSNDETVLEWALSTPARYIGMIGSKSKVLLTYRHLQEKGFKRQELIERVHAPIGLDIGADSPGEIAVSIVAELIKDRRLGQELALKSIQSKRVPFPKEKK